MAIKSSLMADVRGRPTGRADGMSSSVAAGEPAATAAGRPPPVTQISEIFTRGWVMHF